MFRVKWNSLLGDWNTPGVKIPSLYYNLVTQDSRSTDERKGHFEIFASKEQQ